MADVIKGYVEHIIYHNEENGYTIFRYDASKQEMTITRDCEGLLVNGEFAAFELYYKEGNKISGYIDINVDQTMIDKLSGGAIIQGYNLYINKLARIPSQPLQQGENIVWEGSNWFNNWQNALYLSTSMFKKASAGNTVRIYGTFNNGWAVEFLYITNSWQKFSIPEWGDKSQANDQTVTTPGNGGYIEFALTETNLELITGNSQCIVQGTNFEVKKVAIYVGQSDDRTQPTISFGETTAFYQTYGDTFTAPTATCSVNSLTITYTSSNSNVAEVNSSTGSVSIKGAGQATITASTEATTEYKAASASYTIYVGKANVSLYYSSSSATATIGEEWTAPSLNNSENVSVTYSSTEINVATIANNGIVTLVAAGKTTIKANFAGDNNRNAAEASYTLTVNAPETPEVVTDNWSSSSSSDKEAAVLKDDDALKIQSLSASTSDADTGRTILGKSFARYITIRNEDKDGKANTTVQIEAKQNTTIVVYYRRQADEHYDWIYTAGNNKDVKLLNSSNAEQTAVDFVVNDGDATYKSYAYVAKKYNLTENNTYTLTASGTTVRLYGIYYSTDANSSNVQLTPTYKLTYKSDIETIYEAIWLKAGASIPATKENPTKEGYTFTGWTNADYAALPSTMPANDYTAYAQFTENEQPQPSANYESVTFGNYNYRTYVTKNTVDFSQAVGLKGYYAAGVSSDGTVVQFTEVVSTVPAGTPLLLIRESGASETKILISTASATAPSSNLLVAGTDSEGKWIYGSNLYVLIYNENSPSGFVFAEVNQGESAAVDSEHAYLDLRYYSYSSRRLKIKIGDATGINDIESDELGSKVIYDLRGQRVDNPTKGIYIINGKKVVIK